MGNKLLLVGGGGHCKSVIDTILSSYNFDEIGIIENVHGEYASVLGIPVIGCDADLPSLFKNGWENAFITVGMMGNSSVRGKIAKQLEKIGFNVPVIIDRTAVISQYADVGAGTFVGKGAIINAGSIIGKNVIINTGTVVEHDCIIGDFSHIAGKTILCGMVQIGSDSFVGAGSMIKQGIKIGSNVVVGMGSNVLKNISNGMIAYGNPCEVIK